MKKRKAWVPALAGLAVLLALFSLFRFLYLYDNKYTAPPPYGADGVYAFSEVDLDRPLFLIDGWKLSVDGGEERETFIGQYSNFSYVDGGSAFGEAVYRIALRCPGLHALALDLPEIFTDYTLYLDGAPIASRGSGTLVSFVLRDEAELALHVENRTHYYSGLYYPPALGTAAVIANLSTARMLFYTVLTVAALTLAAFSAVLWAGRSRDRLFLHFGFLCLAFVGTCLYPFLWRWGLNGRLGYAMENTARLLMLFEAVAIAACLADWTDGKAYRRIRPVALTLCAACFPCVIFIIPTFDGFINLYGYYSETLFLAGWAALCVCTAGALRRGAVGGAFLAGGCCSLGAGLLANLLNSNRFEPIRGGWQEEYTGFFLVLIFGALMVNYNREVLLKNRQLVTHMEDLVQARTRELHTVLEERKNFFSDMAHNLKAPIAAVHGFISLIREGNLYLDDELREYIRLIESENNEIRHRVQSLSALNAFDRITAPKAPVDVDELLSAVEERNAPDVGVMGVHFSVGRLGRAAVVCAQREKLLTLFENLIYNAIAFTPEGGSITVTPQAEGGTVRITVADSGSGIPPQHLPHIFERFYTTRSGEEGSGLGLYICALTVEELGGTITAESEPGKGAVFVLTLPTQGY